MGVISFSGGYDGVFRAKQRNNMPVCIKPILNGYKPVGFVWTMPFFPQFEARFGLPQSPLKPRCLELWQEEFELMQQTSSSISVWDSLCPTSARVPLDLRRHNLWASAELARIPRAAPASFPRLRRHAIIVPTSRMS